ncbi:uncharacterized protein LOC126879976 isoform X1 [Diabrotica virgifera virgifera]|uniref:Uncharacterized protein LOC114334069 isoform X1 n=1 Tax=Diabrotica virgifera virgifera TaxID=50390 RepID=A0A6P7G5S5_DIAVI|nr:uncharacterized protein LOC126879976 isoform X1 [Diabrotica virgifera virgifera]
MKVIGIIFFSAVIVAAFAERSCPEIPGVGILNHGEEAAGPVGECIHLTCDDGDYIKKTCSTSTDAKCNETPGDPTKRYPECCPYFRCPY